MVAITLADLPSTREMEPSPWFSVQTDPAPTVRNRGPGPTSIVPVTLFVAGSTRVNWLVAGVVTHAAPSPKLTAADFSGTVISAITLLVAGSMRESTPFWSLTI